MEHAAAHLVDRAVTSYGHRGIIARFGSLPGKVHGMSGPLGHADFRFIERRIDPLPDERGKVFLLLGTGDGVDNKADFLLLVVCHRPFA